MEDKITSLRVENRTRNKLIKYKYELGCRSIDDLLTRLLKIMPIKVLKEKI